MCVVSPEASGRSVHAYFEGLGVKSIGYLLPSLEEIASSEVGRPEPTGVGDFLVGAFDAWLDSARTGVRVQIFEAALRAFEGQPSGLAGVGGYKAEWITFASDGSVECGDPFGVCTYEKIKAPDPRVAMDLAEQNEFYRLQAKGGFLPTRGGCRGCDVASVCQGGFLVHRHDRAGGFDNPSRYCADLLQFYTHVALRRSEALSA
jgi:uncharacterized protein